MFFRESDSIVAEHPDLLRVVEDIDRLLSTITSDAPLRPADFACVLGADANQVESVFDLLHRMDFLLVQEVVECQSCQNLISVEDFRQAVEDEDDLECTGCARSIPPHSEPVVVYRMTAPPSPMIEPETPVAHTPASDDEPLSERAQTILEAMLEMKLVDSDTRQPTAEIANKAFGPAADANSMKFVMAELKVRGFIETKEGRGGGCWLTERGRARAEKLSCDN